MSIPIAKQPSAIENANIPERFVRRFAAQLLREPGAEGNKPRRDARSLFLLADSARAALMAGNKGAYRSHIREIRGIAKRYKAKVIDHRDLHGMVVGLVLASGTHRSGHLDWYYLA